MGLLELTRVLKRDLELNLDLKIYKTYRELIYYIEDLIVSHGLRPAFPTTVATDNNVSNWTPVFQDLDRPLTYKICTIDFGVLDPQDGVITDTAITHTFDPEFKAHLQLYRRLIREIEKRVSLLYERDSSLMGTDVTEIVQDTFRGSLFQIIPHCASHTIERNKLHGEVISMVTPGVKSVHLKRGTYFTIEPHVTLGPSYVWSEEGTIFMDRKTYKYETLDGRMGNFVASRRALHYPSVVAEKMSFYEEDTYYLGDTLMNLTRV